MADFPGVNITVEQGEKADRGQRRNHLEGIASRHQGKRDEQFRRGQDEPGKTYSRPERHHGQDSHRQLPARRVCRPRGPKADRQHHQYMIRPGQWMQEAAGVTHQQVASGLGPGRCVEGQQACRRQQFF